MGTDDLADSAHEAHDPNQVQAAFDDCVQVLRRLRYEWARGDAWMVFYATWGDAVPFNEVPRLDDSELRMLDADLRAKYATEGLATELPSSHELVHVVRSVFRSGVARIRDELIGRAFPRISQYLDEEQQDWLKKVVSQTYLDDPDWMK